MNLNASIRIFFKEALKRRKYSYKDVAQALEISESSVKRMLTGQNLSLDQFESLSRFLELSPGDVLLAASQSESHLPELKFSQEQFLTDHPLADYIFIQLTAGFSISEITAKLRISESEIQKQLIKLERHELIRRRKSGAIVVLKRGPFRWLSGGPFEKVLGPAFFQVLAEHFENKIFSDAPPKGLRAFELYMTESALQSFQNEMHDLCEKYRKISKIDVSVYRTKDLSAVSVLTGIDRLDGWRKVTEKRNSQLQRSHRS